MSNESLANLLKEERRFAPPAELAAAANVTAAAYAQASEDRLGFWAEQARRLTWATEPTQTLDWTNPPFAKWFADGALNIAYNCVDRHVEAGQRFIEEQHLRFGRQRARQRDPLCLPTRQPSRPAVTQLLGAHRGQPRRRGRSVVSAPAGKVSPGPAARPE